MADLYKLNEGDFLKAYHSANKKLANINNVHNKEAALDDISADVSQATQYLGNLEKELQNLPPNLSN